MVKNRSQQEVNDEISLQKLHETEAEYFQNTNPWNNIVKMVPRIFIFTEIISFVHESASKIFSRKHSI